MLLDFKASLRDYYYYYYRDHRRSLNREVFAYLHKHLGSRRGGETESKRKNLFTVQAHMRDTRELAYMPTSTYKNRRGPPYLRIADVPAVSRREAAHFFTETREEMSLSTSMNARVGSVSTRSSTRSCLPPFSDCFRINIPPPPKKTIEQHDNNFCIQLSRCTFKLIILYR